MINIECPKCGSDKLIGFDDGSGLVCLDCGHFIKDTEIKGILKEKIRRILHSIKDAEYDIGIR